MVRPSKSLHHWNDEFGILAGRDLQFGGTWLGINRNGLIAALTNQIEVDTQESDRHINEDDVHEFTSRGYIVNQCLERHDIDQPSPLNDIVEEAINQIFSLTSPQFYKGFTLLFGRVIGNESLFLNLRLLYHPMNQRHLPLHQSYSQMNWGQPGKIYTISNGSPFEPEWPKLEKARNLLKSSLDELLASTSETKYQDSFWREYFIEKVLCDRKELDISKYLSKHTSAQRNTKRISSVFVPIDPSSVDEGSEYGTVSSTIVMVGYKGKRIVTTCIEYDWVKYRFICMKQNRSFNTLHKDLLPAIEQVHEMFIVTE